MLAIGFAGAMAAVCFWLAGGDSRASNRRLSSALAGGVARGAAGRGTFGVRRALSRFLPAMSSATTQPTDAQVPSALDVLAACLYSGAPMDQALLAVAAAFDGEIGELLGGVGRRSALGAPAEIAWEPALSDPRWANAARSIVRAHYSGAPLTDVLSRTADERRRELRAAAHAAANKASVRAVIPLGVCFLPAFVLLGVVPVIAGFAGALWA